jgi:hypothetical protein
MTVSITQILGQGGNPPTSILVRGTATSCEKVTVTMSCDKGNQQIATVTGGVWSASFNNKGCGCGDQATATATCASGANASDTQTIAIDCGLCPVLTISTSQPGPCVNGKRTVNFSGTATNVTGPTFPVWDYGDGSPTTSVAQTTSGALANQTHDYVAGPAAIVYVAKLNVVYPMGCAGTATKVAISPCAQCCPTLTLAPAQVSGCAPSSAAAQFNATLTWPAGCNPQPASFNWTVDVSAPGSQHTYQITTLTASVRTDIAGWSAIGGGLGPIAIPAGASCSVSVTAVIVSLPSSCNPTATKSFQIGACCPQLVGPLNASVSSADPCTWLFSAQVVNANGAPLTFSWAFHDGTTQQTSLPQTAHTYAPGTSTQGVTTLTLHSAGCPDQSLATTFVLACPSVSTPPGGGTTTTPPTGGGSSSGCLFGWAVVAIAMIIVFLSIMLAICGAVAVIPAPVVAAALTVIVAGLILLAIFCGITFCSFWGAVIWALKWAIIINTIIAIVARSLCTFVVTIGFGILLAWLIIFVRGRGCTIPSARHLP